MILFTLLNNGVFHHKSLFWWEATPFLRSITDQNVVFEFKVFSVVEPSVPSHHPFVKLCAIKLSSVPYFLTVFLYEASSRFLGALVITSLPSESTHSRDAFTNRLDFRP